MIITIIVLLPRAILTPRRLINMSPAHLGPLGPWSLHLTRLLFVRRGYCLQEQWPINVSGTSGATKPWLCESQVTSLSTSGATASKAGQCLIMSPSHLGLIGPWWSHLPVSITPGATRPFGESLISLRHIWGY